MAQKVYRTIDVYRINGHSRPGSPQERPVDYEAFFDLLAKTPPAERQVKDGSRTIAIPTAQHVENGLAFAFILGSPDSVTTLYAPSTATTESVEHDETRFPVVQVWTIVNPLERVLYLEKKRPGVPVSTIERFLREFAKTSTNLGPVVFSLTPIPAPSFVTQINEMTRIREASLRVERPNLDWSGPAEDALGRIAESDAQSVGVEARASRKQSLRKDAGIVKMIKDMAKRPVNSIRNAMVKGTAPGYAGEKTVSLEKNQVRARIEYDKSSTPSEVLELIDITAGELRQQVENVEDGG